MPHTPHRRGLTLVELLVVVAILGLLMALLLPAVQSVREAARRTQSANNLKQLGIAHLTHLQNFRTFPSGGMDCDRGSWLYHVLPFIEDRNVADKLMTDVSIWWATEENRPTITSWWPAWAFCPSSPLPRRVILDADNRNPDTVDHPMPCYVGISGATDGNLSSGVFKTVTSGMRGIAARNGLLWDSSAVSAASVIDGLSSTLLVGEQSDWTRGSTGVPRDSRSTTGGGPFTCHCDSDTAGTARNRSDPVPLSTLTGGDFYRYNVTTVRYPLNDKTQKVASNGKTWGIYDKPLQSAHPGVVGVVFADGHIAMLADTLELPVLLALASRNDRQPVEVP